MSERFLHYLRREHARLEGLIERERQRVLPDQLQLARLKKLKLAVRDQIAATTGLPASALPFGAELIEIHPEHAAWTGAIERVLRPFALSILVRSDHLPAVRRWVDCHHTGTRVVYEEVPPTVGTPRPPRTDLSLVRRVAVADSHVGKWVATQLAERFDLAAARMRPIGSFWNAHEAVECLRHLR